MVLKGDPSPDEPVPFDEFFGSGWAVNSASELALDSAQISKGFGFRCLLARLYGLRVGIDVARGPEEWAFYIQVGNAWGR